MPPQEIKLKAKYTRDKPKGTNRADYGGNSGVNRHKHTPLPKIHGVRRKRKRGQPGAFRRL